MKIHTFYDPAPSHAEKFTKPTLTDSAFYEPLNVLVERIIRGDLPLSNLSKGDFEFDDEKVSDEIFDGDASDFVPDDLTVMDEVMFPNVAPDNSAKAEMSGSTGAGAQPVEKSAEKSEQASANTAELA